MAELYPWPGGHITDKSCIVCRQHVKIGPTQKWSLGPILAAKNGPPRPLLIVKDGSLLPKLVLAGPNLATKIGLGDHSWQLKVVPWTQFGLLHASLF